MENLTTVPEQQPAPGNPGTGQPELKEITNHPPVPVSNGEGRVAADTTKPASVPKTTASAIGAGTPAIRQSAAAAQAPGKPAKKPLLDPNKYRKEKAPAAEEPSTDGAQSTIPVRKPGSRNFFRAHPDEEYRLYNVPVVEDDQHEWHILTPDLEIPEDLERFIHHVNLITCLNHKGTLFLWPYKNSTNDWSKSASRVARRAVGEWVRLSADMDSNGYRIETAPVELRAVEPEWPKMTFEEILNVAFEDKSIDSLNHPVIRSIRGLGYGPAI